MKTKVFWNPIVRYLVLNSMKLSMSALVVMYATEKGAGDIATSIGLLTLLNGAPFVFMFALRSNKKTLAEQETIKSIGAIYAGKNVESKQDHYLWLYPMVFFWRRTFYIVITVYLFDWPGVQVQAHLVLSLISAGILAVDPSAFESTAQKMMEVGSEALLLFSSICLAQFTDFAYGEDT